jgi:hypothetical protein
MACGSQEPKQVREQLWRSALRCGSRLALLLWQHVLAWISGSLVIKFAFGQSREAFRRKRSKT